MQHDHGQYRRVDLAAVNVSFADDEPTAPCQALFAPWISWFRLSCWSSGPVSLNRRLWTAASRTDARRHVCLLFKTIANRRLPPPLLYLRRTSRGMRQRRSRIGSPPTCKLSFRIQKNSRTFTGKPTRLRKARNLGSERRESSSGSTFKLRISALCAWKDRSRYWNARSFSPSIA